MYKYNWDPVSFSWFTDPTLSFTEIGWLYSVHAKLYEEGRLGKYLLAQLNHVMQCIEKHLSDDITLDDIYSVTLYSSYHFDRLFYYIADMPLSEYIRKRKLTRAAMELRNYYTRVIDITVKYYYDRVDSFT